MNAPRELEDVANKREGVMISQHDYDDTTVIAVDFGPDVGAVSVDIVDTTAIVVADDQQFEFEIPDEADDITVNDGILTIEG